MSERDWLGLLLSFVLPTLLLVVAEAIRRAARWPAEFTRKLVHVGAGMWVFPTLLLFDHWWAATIATGAFVVINYISARHTLIPAMDAARSEGLGTVWFMVSFTILLAWLWPQGRQHIAAAGMMAMTWGDSAASLVGGRFGRHKYSIAGQTKSLEGSIACALFTFLAVTPTLLILAPDRYPFGVAISASAVAGIMAALLEAAVPLGFDNLAVPLGTALLLLLIDTNVVSPASIALGLLLSGLIGVAAYRVRSLDAGGTVGAVLTGTAIFALGGPVWGLLLIAFFVSSSLLSRYGKKRSQKQEAAAAFAKGGQRDLGQVLANGGLAAALAIPYAFAAPDWRLLLFAAFTGALAAVNADTWATEIGVLSRRAPRLITTGRVVPPGTSGGISALGTLAAAGGGLFLGLVAWFLAILFTGQNLPWLVLAGIVGGLAGASLDSLLGATVQGVYWCPKCQRETERPVHSCDTPTTLRRGLRWVDNEVVNFSCSLLGAFAGLLVARILL